MRSLGGNLTEWLLGLVRSGKQSELLGLDMATRAKMGASIDSQLAAVQVMVDHAGNGGIFDGEWDSPERVRDGAIALVNVSTAFAGESGAESVPPEFQKALGALVEKARAKVEQTQAALKAAKTSLASVMSDAQQVTTELLGESIPETITSATMAILAKHNDKSETGMHEAVAGRGSIRHFRFMNRPWFKV